MHLKAVADRVGKPFYAELSSVNPVVFLPGAFDERCDKLIEEYATSGLMGVGQFCTNPGLLLMVRGPKTDAFVAGVVSKYQSAPEHCCRNLSKIRLSRALSFSPTPERSV